MPKKTFYNLPKEKQERIVEAAKSIFAELHYSNVTIDAIVDDSKISKGSFYQYFNDKNDLYKYIFSDIATEKYNGLMEEIEQSADVGFSELIMKMITRADSFDNRDSVMKGLKDKFMKECPQELKNEVLREIMPLTMKMFEETINVFVSRGKFRADFNIGTAAFILTSTVLNLENYNLEYENDHGEVLGNICELMEKGLGK